MKTPDFSKKEMSIKEFILQKKPKNDVQKALVIAYYLENFRNFSSFNYVDITEGFREARENVPKNVWDKLYKNVRKGHMMEAAEEKDELTAYVLTNRGERYVTNDFKSEE